MHIRPGKAEDLDNIAAIQNSSDAASHWDVASYLQYDLRVAEVDGIVAGFMCCRTVGPGELEVLNLVVSPESQRRGIAKALLQTITEVTVFLEVRESNTAAKTLYEQVGFRVAGRRARYYSEPVEDALIMRSDRL
jgi:ribosomal-protein-alanine N-acetyltransferase